MKKYVVEIPMHAYVHLDVTADSKEAAIRQVQDMYEMDRNKFNDVSRITDSAWLFWIDVTARELE